MRVSAAAGSGHPTSSMSAADLLAVLLEGGYLRLDTADLDNPANDHLIFSKGHASPLYYAVLKAAGVVGEEEFLTFRKLGSRLEGHPTPRIPPTDVATGSLGQGLPIGVGVALAGKRLDRLPYRVWVLCGDSEMAEGSMWEAFEHAAFNELDNLTAILDVNRLGQTRETMVGWELDTLQAPRRGVRLARDRDRRPRRRRRSTRPIEEAVGTTGRPTVIVARTKKGKGVKAVEDQPGKHGKPLDDPDAAIEELGGRRDLEVSARRARGRHAARLRRRPAASCPTYEVGEQEATRKAYGEALTALGAMRGDVVALDGEVSNSTHSEMFREAHEDRYFEMFIAEQQMVAAAVGMQVRGWVPFASTFAAFFSRAYDFVRMAAISQRGHPPVRLARRRLDRRGRPVADGARGHRRVPRRARLDGAAPLRRQPDGQARRARWPTSAGISFIRTLRGKTEIRTPPGRGRRGSAARAWRATATTSPSWPAASRSTRRSRPPSSWPPTGSRRA